MSCSEALQAAKVYRQLLKSVKKHIPKEDSKKRFKEYDLLFSYNIAVDRTDEMKRILGKSAASVGLQLPDHQHHHHHRFEEEEEEAAKEAKEEEEEREERETAAITITITDLKKKKKQQKKQKKKKEKREMAASEREERKREGWNSFMGSETFVEVILAIFLPPVGVFLRYGCGVEFWIDLVLTLLGYIPGIIYALYVLVA
uniref:Uncharacterized protein n=1 Tax=Fagus sylvatica TaxID=28930 RepID=A0A2N9IF67_FAGSY